MTEQEFEMVRYERNQENKAIKLVDKILIRLQVDIEELITIINNADFVKSAFNMCCCGRIAQNLYCLKAKENHVYLSTNCMQKIKLYHPKIKGDKNANS